MVPKIPKNGGSTPTPCLDKAVLAQGGGGVLLTAGVPTDVKSERGATRVQSDWLQAGDRTVGAPTDKMASAPPLLTA